MIETERLILRAPEDADRGAIAAMNADPRVAATLGSPLTRLESDALVDRVRVQIGLHGWGFWAVERKADGAVIGLAGLLQMSDATPGHDADGTGKPEGDLGKSARNQIKIIEGRRARDVRILLQ